VEPFTVGKEELDIAQVGVNKYKTKGFFSITYVQVLVCLINICENIFERISKLLDKTQLVSNRISCC